MKDRDFHVLFYEKSEKYFEDVYRENIYTWRQLYKKKPYYNTLRLIPILSNPLRDRGLDSISHKLGLIGFFWSTIKLPELISYPVTGSISPWETFLKNCFTILSSPEWKDITARTPSGTRRDSVLERSFLRVQSSSLTAIRNAWNTFGTASFQAFLTIRANSEVVSIGFNSRASIIFFPINHARGSSPKSRIIRASSWKGRVLTSWAAVNSWVVSSLISRGPSKRKENPLTGL